MIKISFLSFDKHHPSYSYLKNWHDQNSSKYQINIAHQESELLGGDFLFLISYPYIVKRETLEKYKHALVIHASALPKGRGWSPQIWQVLEGKNEIPVTLFEAADKVDSGNIWAQTSYKLEGHELSDELIDKFYKTNIELINYAINNYKNIKPQKQDSSKATFYTKRSPLDSKLDPHKTIAEQFELLRVADPNRFPCFFEYRGHTYNVYLRKREKN